MFSFFTIRFHCLLASWLTFIYYFFVLFVLYKWMSSFLYSVLWQCHVCINYSFDLGRWRRKSYNTKLINFNCRNNRRKKNVFFLFSTIEISRFKWKTYHFLKAAHFLQTIKHLLGLHNTQNGAFQLEKDSYIDLEEKKWNKKVAI